jgi:hypothetical protein
LEAALAGATVVGVAGLIKDKAAVSSKLAATKVNVSATAKACARTDEEKQEFADTARFCLQAAGAANIVSSMHKFARHSPTPKNKPRSTESIATREAELAGTGLKVKVPVEEHGEMPSVSRKADGKGGTSKSQKPGQSITKERIQRTPQDVTNHFKELKKDPSWVPSKEDGKKVYKNRLTGEKRWPDLFHNEIECNNGNKSWVIDPVTGKVLDKKGHLLKAK